MKKIVSKASVFIMVFSMILILLSACSSKTTTSGVSTDTNTEQAPTVDVKQKAPVTIRIGVLDSPGEKENAEAVAKAFSAKYPYITVKVETIVGDIKAKTLAQAAGGDLPDVVWFYTEILRDYVNAGFLIPLDSYMDEVGVDKNDLYPAMLKGGQSDDKTYMVPRDYNHVITFVNTTILKNAGIELPKDDWTWDEFMDDVKKLTQKDASGKTIQWGLAANTTWEPVWGPFTLGEGGNPVDTANKQVHFSDPLVIKGLKDLWDLSKDGYALDPNGQYPEDMFNAGKVAFQFMVKPRASDINKSAIAKGFDWNVIEFPSLPAGKFVGSGASGYGVYAKSKHLDEAGMFAAYFATLDGQKAFSQTGNAVPVVKSLKDDKVWRDNPAPGKNSGAFVANSDKDIAALLETQLPPAVSAVANTVITDAMNKYLLNKSSIEDALKEADGKINDAWKKEK